MTVINRRNAVVGWASLVGRQARDEEEGEGRGAGVDSKSKRPNKSAIALVVASAVGALALAKKRSGGGDDIAARALLDEQAHEYATCFAGRSSRRSR